MDLLEHARKLRTDLNDELPNGVGNTIDALLATIERLSAELENMRAKFRNVISHATGGGTSGEDSPDLSLNEISVRISQFRTRLWNDAKELGAKDAALTLPPTNNERSQSV